jgi:hypothetical protein
MSAYVIVMVLRCIASVAYAWTLLCARVCESTCVIAWSMYLWPCEIRSVSESTCVRSQPRQPRSCATGYGPTALIRCAWQWELRKRCC